MQRTGWSPVVVHIHALRQFETWPANQSQSSLQLFISRDNSYDSLINRNISKTSENL